MKYREFSNKELVWIRKFERLMKHAPESIFMFVGSGSVVIYATDESGKIYMKPTGGVDDDADSISVSTPMLCDGGDW